MSIWLKQSTARTVVMGPLVDAGDGVTAEPSLTISQADIRLSKNGGTFAQTNNSAGATHMENGNYSVPLDTTDTNTLGTLRVAIAESGALPVWRDFMIVPANVWDSFFGADRLQVHVDEMTNDIITAAVIANNAIDASAIASDAITAAKIADGAIDAATFAAGAITATVIATDAIDADALATDAIAEINATVDTAISDAALATAANLATVDGNVDDIKVVTDALTSVGAAKLALTAATIVVGEAVTGTLSTTQMTTDLTEATDNHYNGRIIIWTSGVLQNQATDITDYDGTTKMLTFTTVTEAPSDTDTFVIV